MGDLGFQVEIVSENIVEVVDVIVAKARWMTIYLEQIQIRHYKNNVFILLAHEVIRCNRFIFEIIKFLK